MQVTVTGGTLSKRELDKYIQRAIDVNPGRYLTGLDINIDGDYVDLTYHFGAVPFQRIRRITGYLVGTMDRFNNAKKSEVEDRVKHDVSTLSDQTVAV
jgi:hypothetical protein